LFLLIIVSCGSKITKNGEGDNLVLARLRTNRERRHLNKSNTAEEGEGGGGEVEWEKDRISLYGFMRFRINGDGSENRWAEIARLSGHADIFYAIATKRRVFYSRC